MNEEIIRAIHDRRVLSFTYKGKGRLVEPHTYGCHSNGKDSLCAWQIAGGSGEDFRLYTVAEMFQASATNEQFAGSRTGYHTSDQRFVRIYAEL